MENQNQWQLLGKKTFGPIFITQFLGALNNNLYKNALIILLTFSAINAPVGISTSMMVNICAGLFILPFFFFSAFAGVLADNKEKSSMIRNLKLIEIVTMLIGSVGIFSSNIYLMWIALFCMGIQAAFFGPLKYSILPQHLHEKELMGGNGLIESGTFIAILIGTILGGLLIGLNNGKYYVCALMFIFSVIGYFSSRFIPTAKSFNSLDNNMKVSFFGSMKTSLLAAKSVKSIFLSILAISWFWFLGATLLSQFPLIVKEVLQAPAIFVTILLGVFAIGVAFGSVLCDKLSGHRVEIGLVPFGAFGITVFLYLFAGSMSQISSDIHNNLFDSTLVSNWFNYSHFYMLISWLFLIATFSGFFTVPLYAFVQSRADARDRSKIIGANNILNSIFMVTAAVFAIIVSSLGFNLINLVYILTVMNLLVAVYVFTVVPEFMMRFIVWILVRTIYRIDSIGLNKFPEKGSGLIICNHVSFMDALFIFGLCPRPVKFVMYYKIFNIPFFKYMFNSVGAIPIASKKEDVEVFNKAFDKIDEYLRNDELVVIFPEGAITHDGEMQEFKPGILKVLEKNQVDVYPCALAGLWGSMFSRKDKGIFRYFPKAFFNHKVKFIVSDKIEAKDVSLEKLKEKVLELRGTSL